MIRLGFKQPSELFVQPVDFSDRLASGESISWASTSTSTLKGTATDNPISSSLVSADTVRLTLAGGTSNNFYRLRVLASTSLSNVLEEDLILPCWEFLA